MTGFGWSLDELAASIGGMGSTSDAPTPVAFTTGTVTAVATATATVQFAASSAVPTAPVAGIAYLARPNVGDKVVVAVAGNARLILGPVGGGVKPQVYYDTGAAAHGAVGAAPVTLMSIPIPAQPVACTVHIDASAIWGPTVATDQFEIDVLNRAGSAVLRGARNWANGFTGAQFFGAVETLPANTAWTAAIRLFRAGGTGTASTNTDYRYTYARALVIPV